MEKTWSGARLTRKQTTSRPDKLWPDNVETHVRCIQTKSCVQYKQQTQYPLTPRSKRKMLYQRHLKFQSLNVQDYLDTSTERQFAQNHVPGWNTQSFLSKEICMATFWNAHLWEQSNLRTFDRNTVSVCGRYQTWQAKKKNIESDVESTHEGH